MRRLPGPSLLLLLAGLSAFLVAGGAGARAADLPDPTAGAAARPAPGEDAPLTITNDDLPRHPRISILGTGAGGDGAPAGGLWIDVGSGAWMAPPPTVVYGGQATVTGVTSGEVTVRCAGEGHGRRRRALPEPGWATWTGWTCGEADGRPWCVVRKAPDAEIAPRPGERPPAPSTIRGRPIRRHVPEARRHLPPVRPAPR